MTEQEWLSSTDPQGMLQHIQGKVSARKLRLFACACCRRIWSDIVPVCRTAVEVAERFADGLATAGDLKTANRASNLEARSYTGGTPAECAAKVASYKTTYTNSDGKAVVGAISAADSAADSAAERAIDSAVEPFVDTQAYMMAQKAYKPIEQSHQAHILRDIIGNPNKPTVFQNHLKTRSVVQLAQSMYDTRDFTAIPILGDALEEAGCTNEDMLLHCRGSGIHVRGCWVVDLILGKE